MTWPTNLPLKFDQGTYEERWPSGVVKTKTSIGPGKRRRRFTAVPRYLTGSMTLTPDEAAILESFWYSLTQGGADEFTWEHPRTGAEILCEFEGEIMSTDTEAGDILVTFTVKVLP